MKRRPQQNWHPIEKLSMFSMMVDGILEATEEQHQSFGKAKSRPHVLDDEIIQRTTQAFNNQLAGLVLHKRQFERWLAGSLSDRQRKEVERLSGLLPRIKQLSQEILDMIDMIDVMKDGTIEKVLAKSDFEVGLEFLKKNMK